MVNAGNHVPPSPVTGYSPNRTFKKQTVQSLLADPTDIGKVDFADAV